MAETPRVFQADPKNVLNPEDYNDFRSAKWRIDDTWANGMAQNQYQKEIAGNQYNRSLADLTRQYAQMRERLPGQYAQRGLLNSGIYQSALARFGTERQAATANLAGAYNDTYRGYVMAGTQLEDQRRRATEEVDSQEAARRAAAEALRAAIG